MQHTTSLDHELYMRRAIELAAQVPELPFGAVIVRRAERRILAEGWNQSAKNPTWHGEIVALNELVQRHPSCDGAGLVLYTTAEPCPMCQAAILWCGIETVVYGTSIRFLQEQGWRQVDILASEVIARSPGWRCDLVGGVLAEECNALFRAARRPAAGPAE